MRFAGYSKLIDSAMAGIAIILGLSGLLWALILLGGVASRIAWFSFPVTVPFVAVVVFVWTLVLMIKKRELNRARIATLAVATLAVYPASWLPTNFPFAYPVSEGRVRPVLEVRLPLNEPQRMRPDAAGNYVDIEVTTSNTHLLVAHMKQGSVRVTTGQSVVEGDTLGACGNSGNSTAPHVHIHHQREPWQGSSMLRLAEGLPLKLRSYRGDCAPHGGGAEDATGYWRWTGSVLEHVGK